MRWFQIDADTNQLQQEAAKAAGQFHIEPSAAYVKCRSMLESAAGEDDTLDQSEYIRFLNRISGGEISAEFFEDLDGSCTQIYYKAA